ncbi:hypothetical protein [Sandaracinobacteroides saxicola]|uniref:Uncharacterized protein n=1 Tax=Sandaracinobacteroides saxicola TaxID=2759707 RepID=A0A7G5IGV0_9SPHN|nr:hypothetical protein [Sandaracinobacteroides saxicola]QMW22592.1 hypothetical protein H3309_14940 [Sandaracinobacteroides saxicola]
MSGVRHPISWLGGLAGLLLAQALPAQPVSHVPAVRAAPLLAAPAGWALGRPDPRACIPADRIGGALVLGSRTVELSMRGGVRKRLRFASDCPQLAYYGGFYYKRGRDGQLCAGRDKLMGREGGSCRIAAIVSMRKVKY